MESIEVNGAPSIFHRAAEPASGCLALSHGAGSDMNAPLLGAVAHAMARLGIHVLRYNLPYRRQRTSGPPGPGSAAQDRAGIAATCDYLRDQFQLPVFAGGHSYGGRQTTMLAAERPDLLQGLFLLSYPLHPPRKPEQLRTAHFPSLQTRAFFVHGSRDAFGLPDEMKTALQLIPAGSHLEVIPGKGHDLKGMDAEAVAQAFVRWIKA